MSLDEQLKTHVDFYQSFVEATDLGHREARTRRNYVNNKQWTAEEESVIKRRRQPIITDNQIKRKTDYFLGIERQTRTDPKCFPRTPEHETAAEAFTDGIRFVCDNSDWDIERSEGFDYLVVEGMEGYIVPVEKTPDGIEIRPKHIQWDRIIYDPHSSDRYFRDSKRKGVITWMDLQEAKDLFPGKEDILDGAFNDEDDTVFDDKPNQASWIDRNRNRVKIIQLYYLEKGTWMHCVYTHNGYMIEPEQSTYQDEYGRPDCPIELAGAYIDSDNDRFGLVQDMISLQDMVNKMESKYMHYVNSNQTWGNAKAPNPNDMKREAKKPDGHFKLEGDAVFGEDFGIVPTDNKAIGAFNLLTQAMNSLNQIGGNSIVDEGASGRSKEITAQSKSIELGAVLDTHRQCSKRVYRQVFNRMKQFWGEEKWVRITDDEKNIKFVMLNQNFTFADAFEEKFGEDWKVKMPQLLQHPNINDVMEVRNNIAEIDIDIIVEEAPDFITMQQEQFKVMADLAQAYGPEKVPFEEVLKLSTLRGKDGFLDRTQGSEEQQAQQKQMLAQKAQQAEELQKAVAQVEMQSKQAKAKLDSANAQKTITEANNAQQEMAIRVQEAADKNLETQVNAEVEIRKAVIDTEGKIRIATIEAESGLIDKHNERCMSKGMDLEVENKSPEINITNVLPNADKSIKINREDGVITGAEVSG
ncbi:MAG: hypothetical protein ABFS03_00880 [Chloroflexota bacterium]